MAKVRNANAMVSKAVTQKAHINYKKKVCNDCDKGCERERQHDSR
jgi:hypothetical protein